ncbi:MAG: formyltransferase, partial [Burkholderiaceae bacterium]
MTSAAVFAYHDVGARCLRTLLAHGIRVPLVITHRDAREECVWFESVATVARNYGIPVLTPDHPNEREFAEQIRHVAPD